MMTSSRQLLRRSISCLFHPVEEEKITLMLCATPLCMHRMARPRKGPEDLDAPKDLDTPRELVPLSHGCDRRWRCFHRSSKIQSHTSPPLAWRPVTSSEPAIGAGSCTTHRARGAPGGGPMRVPSHPWWTTEESSSPNQPSQIGLPGGLASRLLGSRPLPQSV